MAQNIQNTVGAVFFDLDGTLTDPEPGIINSIRYAFERLALDLPEGDDLRWCIGPPLLESLTVLLRGRGSAAEALRLYRERFATIGLFENAVFDGIVDVLRTLQAQEYRLYLATSKPQIYAAQILEHFELRDYFVRIFGSELDGTRSDKAELLAYALAKSRENPAGCVMIGDRRHDIEGALRNGMKCIGVLYGFGDEAELTAAGATLTAATPLDILPLLQSIGRP